MASPALDLATALDAIRAVAGRAPTASDEELLADLDAVEAIGRVIDGLRVVTAAEVERRSPVALGEQRLSFRNGAGDGANLVADIAKVSVPEAKRRIGLGSAIAAKSSLLAQPVPADWPVLGDAVTAGDVGLESARIILETAQRIRRRAARPQVEDMVDALTAYAAEHGPDLVRTAATAWQLALDPDGPAPDASGRNAERKLKLGRVWANGAQSFSGVLDPEHRATVMDALQSRRRGVTLERSEPGGDEHGSDCGTLEAEWHEPGDTRTRAQADYDTVAEILAAGLAAEADGHASTVATHEVVITATTDDVEARRGRGWAPGVMTGLPMPAVERIACNGSRRLLVTSPEGEPLYLSRRDRIFSAAQKKALLTASGGRCGVPGCTASAAFLEAHHVHWWHRDTGPTDVSNGIMLCGYHHALVHANHSPIRIRAHDGHLHVVPADRDTGTPDPRWRVQRGTGSPPGTARQSG